MDSDGRGEERLLGMHGRAPASVVPDTENRSGVGFGLWFFGSAESGVEGVRGIEEEEEDTISVVVDERI